MELTYDIFEEFVEAAREFRKDNDMYLHVRKIVISEYGMPVWRALLGWVEATVCPADELWGRIGQYNTKHIPQIIAGGNSATVYSYGRHRVIKKYYNEVFDHDRRFYEYCMNRWKPFLPRVYRIGKDYVVMERLNTYSPLCRAYDEHTFRKPIYNHLPMYRMIQDRIPLKCSGFEQEIYQWNLDVCKTLKDLNRMYPADIRLANLGERPGSNQIVCFDV